MSKYTFEDLDDAVNEIDPEIAEARKKYRENKYGVSE
jgi:hypothetical protein